jgi:integrase/recombinase XerC
MKMKRTQKHLVSSVDARKLEQERFAGFVSDLRRRGRADKTIGSYRSDWIGFNDWHTESLGEVFSILTVEPEAVLAYVEHLRGAKMKPATINRKIVFIKRYIGWANSIGLVSDQRAQALTAIKPVAQGPRRPKGLSDLELKRFLKEVELRASPRDQAIIYVLLGTGMRVSELADLEMSQIVMAARKGVVLLRNEKGHGHRLRKLNVVGTAKRKLGQYLIERGNRAGLLFIGERGPLTPNAIQRIVRKYCGFAKVTASPSILRHTFATSYLSDGGDLVALADILGHESLETTRLYLNVDQQASPVGDTEFGMRPIIIKDV